MDEWITLSDGDTATSAAALPAVALLAAASSAAVRMGPPSFPLCMVALPLVALAMQLDMLALALPACMVKVWVA